MDTTKSITNDVSDKDKLLTQIDNYIEYVTENKIDTDTFNFYDTDDTSSLVKYKKILDTTNDHLHKVDDIRNSIYNKQDNLSIFRNIVGPENAAVEEIKNTSKEIKADISQMKNSLFIIYTLNKEEVLALLLQLKNIINNYSIKDNNINTSNIVIDTNFLVGHGYFDDDDKDYVGRSIQLVELSNNTINILDELNKELLSMYNTTIRDLYDRIDSILANLLVKNIL